MLLGADCLVQVDQLEAALDSYDRVAKRLGKGPMACEAAFKRASILEQMGRQRDALRAYDGVMGSYPDCGRRLDAEIGAAEMLIEMGRADEALAAYARDHGLNWEKFPAADANLVLYAENLLAGSIGSASAHAVIASTVKEEPLGIDELMDMLDETHQVIAYSRELERTTAELKAANERLQELDRLKDDFISTVTHELRTPLTSVRALAEILHDNPELNADQRRDFSSIIIKESERLTRLISQVLDFHKMESGAVGWERTPVDLRAIVVDALGSTDRLIRQKKLEVQLDLPDEVPPVAGDRDRLTQVMVNLLSNAVKFCHDEDGKIGVRMRVAPPALRIDVSDNGVGIRPEDQKAIFE